MHAGDLGGCNLAVWLHIRCLDTWRPDNWCLDIWCLGAAICYTGDDDSAFPALRRLHSLPEISRWRFSKVVTWIAGAAAAMSLPGSALPWMRAAPCC